MSPDVNEAPTFPANTATRSIPENTGSGTNIGSAFTATDVDSGHTLTYSLGGTDAGAFGFDTGSGQITTSASLNHETKDSYSVTITVTDNGTLTDMVTVTINVTDVNEAPVFPTNTETTLSIPENSGPGIDIGNAITAMDEDKDSGDTLTYSLGGTDAGAFGVDTGTGQIKTSAVLDHETKSSYSVTIIVTDSGSLTDTIAVTITVTDVNEAPVFDTNTAATRSIPENTASGTNIGSAFTATDVDGGALTYSLGGTDTGSFGFVPSSRQLQTASPLNFEVKNSYEVTITVTDNGNLTASITVTIGVTNVNEAPVFDPSTVMTRSIAEDSASGTNIGDAFTATDVDMGDTLTYSLGGTDAASFRFRAGTQKLKVGSALNYEGTQNSYEVTIIVTDNGGSTDEITITINVTDVNEAPTFPATTAMRSIAENTGSGTNIGTPVEATDDDNDTLTYTLGGTDASSFNIVSTSGQLQTNSALNYEDKSSYSVIVTVSDGQSPVLTDTITVTINVTNVDEAPVFTEGTTATRTVDENTITETEFGDAILAIGDGTLTYALSGTDAASFGFDAVSKKLETKDALNYEDKNVYTVTITVTGSGGSTAITVTINVTDVNDAPVFTGAAALAENETLSRTVAVAELVVGTAIGDAISATDEDKDVDGNQRDTLTYSVGGTNGALFGIVTTTGQLQVIQALIDDAGTEYVVTVTANDGVMPTPATASVDVTITVTRMNRRATNSVPVFNEGSSTSRSVVEGTTAGRNIGDPVIATDVDDDTLTYGLIGTDANSFSIKTNSGQLQTKDALDHDTKSSYSVSVTVTDGKSGAITIAVTINVTGLADAPALLAIPAKSALLPNYPNPFNPETWIPYQLSKSVDVTFTIYNMRGVIVRELALGYKSAGYHTSKNRAAYWNGRNNFGEKVAAGVYFSTLKAGDYTATRKLLIRK